MIRATYAPIGDPDSMNSAEGGLAIGELVAWPETSQSFSQRFAEQYIALTPITISSFIYPPVALNLQVHNILSICLCYIC